MAEYGIGKSLSGEKDMSVWVRALLLMSLCVSL